MYGPFSKRIISIRQVASQKTTSLIWVSIPCTGGSAWQRYNLAYGTPSTKDKVKGHRETFDLLWANLVRLMQELRENQCFIAIEWPRGCSYWLLSRVKSFVSKYTPTIVHLDGCMFGLKDRDGGHIRKPWKVVTNLNTLLDTLGYCCDVRTNTHDAQGP